MLNKLSKVLQCSAVTIALAFLICPDFNWVYAQPETEENSELFNQLLEDYRDLINEMNDSSLSDSEIETFWWGPDADDDGIGDKSDVCVNDSYRIDYHEACLRSEGLELPWIPKVEELVYNVPYRQYGFKIPIITNWTYQNTEIRKCWDLKRFRDKMKRISDRWADYAQTLSGSAAIAILLVLIITGGPISGIGAAIIAVAIAFCLAILRAYQGWYSKAAIVYENLCVVTRR